MWNAEARCQRLGASTASTADWDYNLLDPYNPAAGVAITYQRGDQCNSQISTPRALTIKIKCDESDFENVPDDEDVDESATCAYQLTINSAHGCPKECPVSTLGGNPSVCGHGRCDYDVSCSAARCFCDENYFGPDCSATCPSPSCSNHGVCAYDTDAKKARCFCNLLHGGDDCSQPAGIVSSLGTGAVAGIIVCVALVVGVAAYTAHRRSIGLAACPLSTAPGERFHVFRPSASDAESSYRPPPLGEEQYSKL